MAITSQDACLSSRDGSDVAMKSNSQEHCSGRFARLGLAQKPQSLRKDGVKLFGEPCVWCDGKSCDVPSLRMSAFVQKKNFKRPVSLMLNIFSKPFESKFG